MMRLTRLCYATICLWSAVAGVASASPLVNHSSNGPALQSTITVGYPGTGSLPADFLTDAQNLLPPPPVPGALVALAATAVLAPPAGGIGTADGTIKTEVMYGLGNVDSFSFNGLITLSALTALNTAGNPAGADVQAFGTVTFFLDPGLGISPVTGLPTVAGELVGSLALAAPGALGANELLRSIDVVKDPGLLSETTIASLSAGDPGTTVDLKVGSAYQVKFGYAAGVPNGVDPVFMPDFTATVVEIPEPSTLSLAIIALLGVVGCGWRKRQS